MTGSFLKVRIINYYIEKTAYSLSNVV